jgi:hypothetical protein
VKPLAVLLVTLCASCAGNPPPAEEPTIDRIRCIPLAAIPDSHWCAYLFTFECDTLTLPAFPEPTTA